MSSADEAGTAFFAHPRALATLFATEMWERFSYYGMRVLLIFYLPHASRQPLLLIGAAVG